MRRTHQTSPPLSVCATFAVGVIGAATGTEAQISFTNVAGTAGLDVHTYTSDNGHALGVIWIDFNEDGLPDLFATNGYNSSCHLYQNNGDGTFSDADALQKKTSAMTTAAKPATAAARRSRSRNDTTANPPRTNKVVMPRITSTRPANVERFTSVVPIAGVGFVKRRLQLSVCAFSVSCIQRNNKGRYGDSETKHPESTIGRFKTLSIES